MISEAAFIRYIVVENEHDALILENSLIKQLKPKYNILLRDDKTYPYIYFDENESFPRLEITRKILPHKGVRYFGPYTTGARELLESLYELLPLVQKKGCLKAQKACLFSNHDFIVQFCNNSINHFEDQSIVHTWQALLAPHEAG